jgi:hypothetical protein
VAGAPWREVHETRLHYLGNLTLTGYNTELSNSDFRSKRAVFLNSPIYLSRSITQVDRWDDASIQRRGEELAELALSVWPYFGPKDLSSTRSSKSGFTGRIPISVIALGTKQDVATWREVLQVTLEAVRDASPDVFDGIADKFPRLLSTKPGTFRSPRSLAKSELYFEANLSAASVVRYCQQIVDAAGYSSNEWSVDTR